MTTDAVRPVRWGVLSTARIGVQKVIPAMLKSPGLIEVAAIASRDGAAAQAAAGPLGIAKAYGSYDALLADPSIEAIYNPLPNHLHVPLTLAAAQAGKHVLCEKPMALQAQALEALRPYARRVHLREAFMVRHHPQWTAAREAVRAGAIGTLRHAQVTFNYFNDDAANIRNVAAAGGGALYDIGCYAVAAGRWFFEREPGRVTAALERDPAFGTDRLAAGILDFGARGQLAFSVCTQALRHQRLVLTGSAGRLDIELPFNPLQDAATRFFIEDAAGLRQVDVPPADQYRLQAEAFSRAIRQSPPDAAGLDDAVAMARVMDALFLSAASGRFEAPGA